MIRRLGVVAAGALLVGSGLTACTTGDDSVLPPGGQAPVDSEAPAAPTTTELQLRDGQTRHTVGVTFQYGAFEVTIGDVVYDEPSAELLLGLRFRNLGDSWSMPETQATLTVDGDELPVLGTVVDIPPRGSADLTWTVSSIEDDPVPEGTLLWGRPDRDQPRISLDGSGDNLWRPIDVEVDGWAGIGKYTVHLTGAQVLAASPELGAQADTGTRILRVHVDTFTHRLDPVNGFFPLEHLTLRRPDGSSVEGVASSPGFAPVTWTSVAGSFTDFPISADFAGSYELAVSSLSPAGFSTLHPDLVERVAIPFELDAADPSDAVATDALPVPDLSATDADGSTTDDDPVSVSLNAPPVNVGGFLFQPTAFRWDPASRSAELDGDVRWIETETPADMESLVGGLLDVPPQFSFTSALVSRGRYFSGITAGSPTVDPAATTPITLEFLDVAAIDPDDLGLVIGPRTGASSSVPLTAGSSLPHYPPPPVLGTIDAQPVVAGDWTIQLEGYRVGFLQSTNAPRPGRLELEVFFSVTAAPNAVVRSLGLSFRPSVQLFLAQSDGYMQQPSGDSGLVFYEPGETKRQSVTFHVADVFAPRLTGFVLRSADESTEVTIDQFVETTFGAQLRAPADATTEGP